MKIAKTIKLFIGGDFPRTESGRSFPITYFKKDQTYAQVCLASRKDLRNAVTVALEAQKGWSSKTSYLRGQILYRMAEMLQARQAEIISVMIDTLGLTNAAAETQVNDAIDVLVYYAGFSDKYQQILGAVNPVSGPHHNFTTSEATGVVGVMTSENFNLVQFISNIAAIVVSGNTVVALMAKNGSALLAPLAEVFATSDLPKGVINLLSGDLAELYTHFASHMEINALSCHIKNAKVLGEIKSMAAGNLKRVHLVPKEEKSLEYIMQFLEFKTVWHPIGN